MRFLGTALVVVALLPSGCYQTSAPPDAGAGLDARVRDDALAATDATSVIDRHAPIADAAIPDDDFDSAIPLGRFGGYAGWIDEPGDVDHYSFEGYAGEWIGITVDPPLPRDRDTQRRIVLYGPDREQLAQSAGVVLRLTANLHLQLVLRLPVDGTYVFRVEHVAAPDDILPSSYDTQVFALWEEMFLVDTEPGDDASSATTTSIGYLNTFERSPVLAGELGERDTDVFSFTSTSGDRNPERLSVRVMPSGPAGWGSTRGPSRVWITDPAGAIVARNEVGDALTVVAPGLRGGTHLLWIEGPAGPPGVNDHYVVDASLGRELSHERFEATNGALAGAEPRGRSDAGYDGIFGRLVRGDVDYYRVDVPPDVHALSVRCESRTVGSGVLGLTAELRTATDAPLATSVETELDAASIDATAIPEAGTYYLRLSSTGHDAEVIGDWYRCVLTT